MQPHSLFAQLALALVITCLSAAAAAQAGGGMRTVPAAKQKPQDVVEEERRAAEKIPAPPGKGKGRGKVLQASPQPPPDVAAEQRLQADAQKVPRPPGKARSEDLVEKIKRRPGGAERVDAARKRQPPGQLKQKPNNPGKPTAQAGGSMLDAVVSFFVAEALAGETFTLDLTPQVDSYGRHRSLYSQSPYGYATFYGGYVSLSYPSNDKVYMVPTSNSGLGHAVTNPYVLFSVNLPADGWYIANINALVYGNANVQLRHSESGGYVLLEDLPRQSGWADYPTLQYLAAGYHYFYWVLPSGAFVSRVSMDSYP